MKRTLTVFAALLFAIFLSGVPAVADTVTANLSHGSFDVTRDPEPEFAGGFSGYAGGKHFSVSGNGSEIGPPFPCLYGSCEPDQIINMGGQAGGSSLSGGTSVFINGVRYRGDGTVTSQVPVTFEFVSPNIMLPAPRQGSFSISAPFRFAGGATIAQINESIFFRGHGVATLYLTSVYDGEGTLFYDFDRVTYIAQTPEPATITLLGGGLVGLIVRYRRKRNK